MRGWPLPLSPVTKQRITRLRAHRRGWWSLCVFVVLFTLTLFADVLANDRPVLIRYEGGWYVPIVFSYPETTFGGEFPTEADYRDPYVAEQISSRGWMVWPPIRYSYRTINYNLTVPAPSPPSTENWLGTDDQGRDVLARLLYGFRISTLFGITLTIASTSIALALGATQGFFGGWIDLALQRFIEVWSSIPTLFLLLILSSVIEPGFWWLLGFLLLFNWIGMSQLVRTEFLRTRNLDYVRAARALGAGNLRIIRSHVLPNALVATLTFVPFSLSSGIIALAALDFLGFGLPPGSASLGELLNQGKSNLQAPWLGLSGFLVIAVTLTLVLFIGEGVRDAFDPRRDTTGR